MKIINMPILASLHPRAGAVPSRSLLVEYAQKVQPNCRIHWTWSTYGRSHTMNIKWIENVKNCIQQKRFVNSSIYEECAKLLAMGWSKKRIVISSRTTERDLRGKLLIMPSHCKHLKGKKQTAMIQLFNSPQSWSLWWGCVDDLTDWSVLPGPGTSSSLLRNNFRL